MGFLNRLKDVTAFWLETWFFMLWGAVCGVAMGFILYEFFVAPILIFFGW
jgi:hypothetical protein